MVGMATNLQHSLRQRGARARTKGAGDEAGGLSRGKDALFARDGGEGLPRKVPLLWLVDFPFPGRPELAGDFVSVIAYEA